MILAESNYELQAALNGMSHYCTIWKLRINTSKTKIVIFGNSGRKSAENKYVFKLRENVLDIMNEYVYLGVCFQGNGHFTLLGMKRLYNQANRAMYSLLSRSRKLGLALDIQLQLFDSLVVPISIYECEIWGFSKLDIAEQLHLQYCRILLKVNKQTPKCMLYAELGR